MNKLLAIFAVTLICVAASCNKTDKTTTTTGNNNTTKIQPGNWKITMMSHNATDETAHFAGYTFSFGSAHSIFAGNGQTMKNGNYLFSNSDTEMTITDFDNDWEELNEDWKVLENTDNKIRLQHTSGGNGGTDLLTFEKGS